MCNVTSEEWTPSFRPYNGTIGQSIRAPFVFMKEMSRNSNPLYPRPYTNTPSPDFVHDGPLRLHLLKENLPQGHQVLGFRVVGLRLFFRIWGLGLRIWGLGFRIWGLGLRVWGLGFRIWGLGLRVWG